MESFEAWRVVGNLAQRPFRGRMNDLATELDMSRSTLTRVLRGGGQRKFKSEQLNAIQRLVEKYPLELERAPARLGVEDRATRSIEELIDLVIQAQQPQYRQTRGHACAALLGTMASLDTSRTGYATAAILLAQLALLDGALGVERTFALCRSPLKDLAESDSSERADVYYRSLACTALGRAAAIQSAMISNRKRRIECIHEAIRWFARAGDLIPDLSEFSAGPDLPLIWAIDEHPVTRWRPGDEAKRTPFSRFFGPVQRYLLWMHLILAFEYLLGPEPEWSQSTDALDKAQLIFKKWVLEMRKWNLTSDKHLVLQEWTLRLKSITLLQLELAPGSGRSNLSQRRQIRREVEQLLGTSERPASFTGVEIWAAEALTAQSPRKLIQSAQACDLFNSCDSHSVFGIDHADLRLFPLARIAQMTFDQKIARLVPDHP